MTCSLAGGPNQRRDSSDNQEADTRCAKCMFYEQLDLDYLSYVKRDLSRALDEPFPCMEASEDDSDSDIDDIWKTNHSYHLAWAVFKHLTGACCLAYLIFYDLIEHYFHTFFCHLPPPKKKIQIGKRTVP